MAVLTRTDVLHRLADHVVTPVVREPDAKRAQAVVQGLREAGFRVFEITLSTPGAFDLIADLTDDPELVVGAGTVVRPEDARRAVEAGSTFIVGPAMVPDVIEIAHDGAAAAVVGAMTPTEVVGARNAGADAIKIFPAASVGGPSHIKALLSVFPDVPMVPTGGVDLDNLSAYLDAGAHSVGVGGALSHPDVSAIPDLGRRYLAAARAAFTRTQGDTTP